MLYVGVTNNWQKSIEEHNTDSENTKQSFAGKYNCRYLLHLEEYMFINDAIAREKEIKGWSRLKKERLINENNPNWIFLNAHV